MRQLVRAIKAGLLNPAHRAAVGGGCPWPPPPQAARATGTGPRYPRPAEHLRAPNKKKPTQKPIHRADGRHHGAAASKDARRAARPSRHPTRCPPPRAALSAASSADISASLRSFSSRASRSRSAHISASRRASARRASASIRRSADASAPPASCGEGQSDAVRLSFAPHTSAACAQRLSCVRRATDQAARRARASIKRSIYIRNRPAQPRGANYC